MTDENLVQIAVDRSTTTVPASSWFYGVDPAGAGADFVISYENLTAEVERDIGTKYFVITPVFRTEPLAVSSVADIPIPSGYNGWSLTYARARVITPGTTNATTIDVYNVTDSVSMLTGYLSVASGAYLDDGTTVNIDEAHDDIATDDWLRIDIKAISTTPPQGLIVTLGFDPPPAA